MKFCKKIVIMFVGISTVFTGLLTVNAGPHRKVCVLFTDTEIHEIDEPQEQTSAVSDTVAVFATILRDSMKRMNPEVLDSLKHYTVGNLFDIAREKRQYLKVEVKKSTAYKELMKRYGENTAFLELLEIAKVLEETLKIRIPRVACRSKYELIKWYDNHWDKIFPFLDYITLEENNS